MPEPVSRYHGPFAGVEVDAGRPSSSAARPRGCRSCRRARRRAPAPPRSSSAPRRCPCRRATLAGSAFGPISTKSLYITGEALDAEALGDELLLGRLVVHEHHVGVAAPAPCRAPGRCRARRRAPRCRSRFSKTGSRWPNRPDCSVEVVEATVMNLLLRAGGCEQRPCGSRRARCRNARRRVSYHGSSPSRKASASRRRGPVEEAVGRRALERCARRCRNRISSPRRRAWPRLCVVITIFVPRAWIAAITRSTSRVAAGSRLAVGSSRNSTSGRERPGARQRQALLLAAGEHARRPLRQRVAGRRARAPRVRGRRAASRGTPAHAPARTSRSPRAERRSSTGRWNTIAWRRGASGGSGAPQARVPDVGRSRPCSRRSSTLLPAPFGPTIDGARARARATRSTPSTIAGRRPNDQLERASGSSDDGAACGAQRHPYRRWRQSRLTQRDAARVERQHDREQHDAEAERQRQVALAGLERDRGRHHARDAVDVAADDHHRADLGDRAAEAGEHDASPARSARPTAASAPRASGPAPSERSCSPYSAHASSTTWRASAAMIGDDQDGLRDHHRGRREQQAERAERARARQQQVDGEPDDHRRQSHQRVEQRRSRRGDPGSG